MLFVPFIRVLFVPFIRVVFVPFIKPAAHESPRLRYRSVAAGGARQERPRTTCAHKLHPHLAARGRETNICCV